MPAALQRYLARDGDARGFSSLEGGAGAVAGDDRQRLESGEADLAPVQPRVLTESSRRTWPWSLKPPRKPSRRLGPAATSSRPITAFRAPGSPANSGQEPPSACQRLTRHAGPVAALFANQLAFDNDGNSPGPVRPAMFSPERPPPRMMAPYSSAITVPSAYYRIQQRAKRC